MKRYRQEDLNRCKICEQVSTVIIKRNVGGITALYAYCDFHALQAEQLFGYSKDRMIIKGGFRVA